MPLANPTYLTKNEQIKSRGIASYPDNFNLLDPVFAYRVFRYLRPPSTADLGIGNWYIHNLYAVAPEGPKGRGRPVFRKAGLKGHFFGLKGHYFGLKRHFFWTERALLLTNRALL